MNAKELLTKRRTKNVSTVCADVALSNVLWLCTKTNVVKLTDHVGQNSLLHWLVSVDSLEICM